MSGKPQQVQPAVRRYHIRQLIIQSETARVHARYSLAQYHGQQRTLAASSES